MDCRLGHSLGYTWNVEGTEAEGSAGRGQGLRVPVSVTDLLCDLGSSKSAFYGCYGYRSSPSILVLHVNLQVYS